jgi:hypothetical protein
MKLNIILGLLVAVLGYVTCKSLKKTEASAPNTAQAEQAELPWKASYVGGEHADTAGILQLNRAPAMVKVPIDEIPPASTSRRAYLSTGWWHCNMALQPSDTAVHLQYQKKWLKFREDQTFDILIDKKTVDTGRWNWDETSNTIYLSCKDPYINNTWAVQDKGWVMIWKGNTKLNVTGIQVRVVGTRVPPE